jgi:hypothetical protein
LAFVILLPIAAELCDKGAERGQKSRTKNLVDFCDDVVKKNCQFGCKMVVPFVVVLNTDNSCFVFYSLTVGGEC